MIYQNVEYKLIRRVETYCGCIEFYERKHKRLSTRLIEFSQMMRIRVFGTLFDFLTWLNHKLIVKDWYDRDRIEIIAK
jgi:hypothetical protein